MRKAFVFRAHNRRWYYRVRNSHGEYVYESAGYMTRWGAKRAVRREYGIEPSVTVMP